MINLGNRLVGGALLHLLLGGHLVQAQETELPDAESTPGASVPVISASEAGERAGLPAMPPRENFAEILQRPLFNESRRPSAETGDEVAGVSAGELREQWKLTGVVIVGGEVRAMLQQREGGQHLTLVPGMPLDASWMLEEINPDSVIMTSGDDQVRLELMTPRGTEPVTPVDGAESEHGEASGTDERVIQPEARETVTRRLRQSTEVSDE